MLNLQKNYLQKYQQIYPQSSEWSLIEYRLQLNLGNASAQLNKVYCVINPYLNTQFERDNKGMIISEVYIKPQDLVDSNRIERVCQKGFQFPSGISANKGILFNVGQVNIDPNSKTQHELLVAKICPRRSYPFLTDQKIGQTIQCPQGFDSIYYPSSSKNLETYTHQFKLYKKLQTLPFYVIQFSFNPQHERKLKTTICKSCNDQAAKIFCVTQNVYFCKKCDYQHHKNKISTHHDRIPLSQKHILDFGACHNHKTNKNQLFCKVCNISMCMSCKIYGDHAEGFMAKHQLSKIMDYYHGTTKKIDEMQPNLEKRKDQLEELLGFVNSKIDLINLTAKNIQKELVKIFQDSLQSLQFIVHRKMSYLISDQFQIRRQYDYIQWMESFLKYQYQVLPLNDFLIAWTKHTKLRRQILSISNIPPVTDVKANFQIEGALRIKQSDITIGLKQDETNVDKFISSHKGDTMPDRQAELTEKHRTQFRKKIFQREEPKILNQNFPS